METIADNIYNYPRYYDLVYGTDCAAELKMICDVNERFLGGKAKRLFEPACGTGRLLIGLAKPSKKNVEAMANFEVEGIDLNERAIEFSNQRFKRHGLAAAASVADMTDFKVKRKFDLAFNTVNSFRHLETESAAVAHLKCMAHHTKKNGIYMIGLHLSPTQGDPVETESWAARRGNLSVLTHMWTIERNLKARVERFGVHFDVYTPTKIFRIEDELRMRSYKKPQFEKLVAKSEDWVIEETYDFAYDITAPIEVDSSSEDVLFILRRK